MADFDIRPMGATFGAEITGLDVRAKGDNTEAAVKRAMDEHRVLVFHDQTLSPDEQMAFSRRFGPLVRVPYVKPLADHPDVKWTFLFLHEPAWENPSESFRAIEELLKGRDHTFFAGHLHYYDYDNIDGHEHITMGPAGASFHQEGPGNVDHLMWVTTAANK